MRTVGTFWVALAVAACAASTAQAQSLNPGDPAPPFSLPGTDGKHPQPRRLPGQDRSPGVVPQGLHRRLNGRVQVAACEQRPASAIRHRLLHGEC